MDRVQRYLFSNFVGSFASLFSTLFIIMSIVFFLQIARITSFIEINFSELVKLYLFMLPRILIFTVPIAFFVALSISLFRLSKENETIVIFTIGYATRKIALFFGISAALCSLALLFVSLFMMPIAENLKDNFIDYKKISATLNIKSNEFGQKFSDWLVFIDSQENNGTSTLYKDLVLYNPGNSQDHERMIVARSGEFKNENASFSAMLHDGKIYTMGGEQWHVSEFESLTLRTQSDRNIRGGGGVIGYWSDMSGSEKRRKEFSIYTLVSLFPLSSFLFALSLGIVTYRYEKGFVYTGIFGVLFSYFALIMLLSKHPSIALPVTFGVTLIGSLLYYRIKIAPRY